MKKHAAPLVQHLNLTAFLTKAAPVPAPAPKPAPLVRHVSRTQDTSSLVSPTPRQALPAPQPRKAAPAPSPKPQPRKAAPQPHKPKKGLTNFETAKLAVEKEREAKRLATRAKALRALEVVEVGANPFAILTRGFAPPQLKTLQVKALHNSGGTLVLLDSIDGTGPGAFIGWGTRI